MDEWDVNTVVAWFHDVGYTQHDASLREHKVRTGPKTARERETSGPTAKKSEARCFSPPTEPHRFARCLAADRTASVRELPRRPRPVRDAITSAPFGDLSHPQENRCTSHLDPLDQL